MKRRRMYRRTRGMVLLAGCGLLAATAGPSPSAAAPASRQAKALHTTVLHAAGVFGKRYCELLLVHPTKHGLLADVYNTFGLNNCPPGAWKAVDTNAVAKAEHAIVALRNGPRFWLMNDIYKLQPGPRVIRNLGGVRMAEVATVAVDPANIAPYTVHRVDRATVWVFKAGQTVYELRAPDGSRWVMQSWSRQIDPTLRLADLKGLRSKLRLPAGWSYRPRRLRRQLRIVTTHRSAQVIQDNLDDTYSRI